MKSLGIFLAVIVGFIILGYVAKWLNPVVAKSRLVHERAPHVVILNENIDAVQHAHIGRRPTTPPRP